MFVGKDELLEATFFGGCVKDRACGDELFEDFIFVTLLEEGRDFFL